MKLWVDDIREAPKGYVWCRTVYDAINMVRIAEKDQYDPLDNYHPWNIISVIDMDHDAGDFAEYGGDYIRLLDWLEETGRNYPIRIHSANAVGVANMRRIIQRNNWKEVF